MWKSPPQSKKEGDPMSEPTERGRYVNPYLAGAVLGVVLFAAYFLTGSGLGASGGINRVVVFFEDLVASGHVDRVSYLAKMAGGEKNPLDHWIVVMIAGVMIGGFFSGLVHRRVKVETLRGPGVSRRVRWIAAFIGGMLMGYGARFARGCTSGQALSGGAVMAVGSWAFMFAVFAGGFALAYFFRNLWIKEES